MTAGLVEQRDSVPDNVDPANFTLVSKAFANTVARMAFDTKIMSASNSATYPPKSAIGARHFTAK